MERITIIHNGKTLTVFKKDVSEKVWQELKDERPLNTAGDFKSIDVTGAHLENRINRYINYNSNLKNKDRKSILDSFDNLLLGLCIGTIICFSAYLIYNLLK
jgi:hypothetical protein